MDEQIAAQDQPQPKKQQREQSTIGFPYTDLNDAIGLARAIWEKVGTSTCDQAQLAAWAGHDSVDSGAFRTRMSGARTFGLITSGSKQVALTDLGSAVVDPDRAAQARIEAFLNVPLYGRMFERYEGRTLPTTNVALEADLVDLGVAEKQKDRARQVFQRSAEQAGFFAQGRNRLVRPATAPREDRVAIKERQGGDGGGGGGGLDPFVQVLVSNLPKAGSVWPKAERAKWIALANAAFEVVYKEESPTPSSNAPQPPSEQSLADAQD